MENTTSTNPELKFSNIYKKAASATLKNLHKFIGIQILYLIAIGAISFIFFVTAIGLKELLPSIAKLALYLLIGITGSVVYFYFRLVNIKLSIQSTSDSQAGDSIFDINFNQFLKVFFIYLKIFFLPTVGMITTTILTLFLYVSNVPPIDQILESLNFPQVPQSALFATGIFTLITGLLAVYLYFKLYLSGHLLVEKNPPLSESQLTTSQTMNGNKFKFFALTILTGILIGILSSSSNLIASLFESPNFIIVGLGIFLIYLITQILFIFKNNVTSRFYNVLFNFSPQDSQNLNSNPVPEPAPIPAPITTPEPTVIPQSAELEEFTQDLTVETPTAPEAIPTPPIPEPIQENPTTSFDLNLNQIPQTDPITSPEPIPMPQPELTIPEPTPNPIPEPIPNLPTEPQTINLAELESITPVNPVIAEIQNQPIATPQPEPTSFDPIPTATPEITIPASQPELTIPEPTPNPTPNPIPPQNNPGNNQTPPPPTPPTFQL